MRCRILLQVFSLVFAVALMCAAPSPGQVDYCGAFTPLPVIQAWFDSFVCQEGVSSVYRCMANDGYCGCDWGVWDGSGSQHSASQVFINCIPEHDNPKSCGQSACLSTLIAHMPPPCFNNHGGGGGCPDPPEQPEHCDLVQCAQGGGGGPLTFIRPIFEKSLGLVLFYSDGPGEISTDDRLGIFVNPASPLGVDEYVKMLPSLFQSAVKGARVEMVENPKLPGSFVVVTFGDVRVALRSEIFQETWYIDDPDLYASRYGQSLESNGRGSYVYAPVVYVDRGVGWSSRPADVHAVFGYLGLRVDGLADLQSLADDRRAYVASGNPAF